MPRPKIRKNHLLGSIKKRSSTYLHLILNKTKRRPFLSFILSLIVLFLFIVVGNVITSPSKSIESKPSVKNVETYKIGTAPKINVQAKIEKSGIIKITALSGGVIQAINVKEGDTVVRGTNLFTISTNYQGANAPQVQASIAQQQYKNILDTYQKQKDLIQRQRDLADRTQNNSQELRNISEQSISETQSLLNLDQDIVNTLGGNLTNYEASNSAGQNNASILQTKQLISQFQSAINGLNQSLRSTQYQSSDSNPPADLAVIQKDIALSQLDLQEKTLELNKEVARLQAVLAQINADIMHPVAPIQGRVERIYVKEGQAVTPGTVLLLLSGDKGEIVAVATVSKNIAKNVSQIENSILYFGNKTYENRPFFISSEATDNQLFNIQFSIPDDLAKTVTDGEYISIELPIGYPDTNKTIPYIPLDALYQSQEQAYLFVIQNGKAVSKTITLGQVYGRFVEVWSGLNAGDQVILNRNIISGDLVSPIY